MKLTNREREVLRLIAHEYTTNEIVSRLYISAHTVLSHRKNILEKMQVRNTAGMVRKGFEKGLLRATFALLLTIGISYTLVAGICVNNTIIHVKQGSHTIQDGTTWGTAYSNLHDALSEAKTIASVVNPIEIWVAAGTYYPDEGTGYTDNARDSSFYLINSY